MQQKTTNAIVNTKTKKTQQNRQRNPDHHNQKVEVCGDNQNHILQQHILTHVQKPTIKYENQRKQTNKIVNPV